MIVSAIASLVLSVTPAPAPGCHYVGKIVICPDWVLKDSSLKISKFVPVLNPEPVGTGGTGTRFKDFYRGIRLAFDKVKHRGSGRIEDPV